MLRWRFHQLAHEFVRVQPHEARIAEELDPCLLEGLVEHGIELSARSEVLVVDHERRDAGRFSAGEPLRAGNVRQHQDDLGGVVGSRLRFDQGLKVRSSAGDQDADSLPRHDLSPSVPA